MHILSLGFHEGSFLKAKSFLHFPQGKNAKFGLKCVEEECLPLAYCMRMLSCNASVACNDFTKSSF